MGIHSADQTLKRLKFETSGVCDLRNAKTILPVTNKANSYTVTEAESGTVFTTYAGADNMTFTLPVTPRAGLHYKFIDCTANNVIVAVATAANNTFMVYGDATADSVTITDIGVGLEVIGTGNNWVCVSFGHGSNDKTITVA